MRMCSLGQIIKRQAPVTQNKPYTYCMHLITCKGLCKKESERERERLYFVCVNTPTKSHNSCQSTKRSISSAKTFIKEKMKNEQEKQPQSSNLIGRRLYAYKLCPYHDHHWISNLKPNPLQVQHFLPIFKIGIFSFFTKPKFQSLCKPHTTVLFKILTVRCHLSWTDTIIMLIIKQRNIFRALKITYLKLLILYTNVGSHHIYSE